MSRAILTYGARGMNLRCIQHQEFGGLKIGEYYRIEVYLEEDGNLQTASYKRRGSYWHTFSNQMLAIAESQLLKEYIQSQKQEAA